MLRRAPFLASDEYQELMVLASLVSGSLRGQPLYSSLMFLFMRMIRPGRIKISDHLPDCSRFLWGSGLWNTSSFNIRLYHNSLAFLLMQKFLV